MAEPGANLLLTESEEQRHHCLRLVVLVLLLMVIVELVVGAEIELAVVGRFVVELGAVRRCCCRCSFVEALFGTTKSKI